MLSHNIIYHSKFCRRSDLCRHTDIKTLKPPIKFSNWLIIFPFQTIKFRKKLIIIFILTPILKKTSCNSSHDPIESDFKFWNQNPTSPPKDFENNLMTTSSCTISQLSMKLWKDPKCFSVVIWSFPVKWRRYSTN